MLLGKDVSKEKVWLIKSENSPAFLRSVETLAHGANINPVIAKLLYNRGYCDPVSVRKFIHLENEVFCNPFLFKDMDLGTERLSRALKNNEKITVYGDYDVDGVTAVCTLYLYLKSKGADVEYYIPNRTGEGYGVSAAAIDQIKENGSTLIITVDTGITAIEEVEYAKTQGIDFIITDHHECRNDLPKAEAVINPHRPDCPYPFKDLAGVGVVFKFVTAFEEYYTDKDRLTANLDIIREYADLVAIGTIADVMPIKEENRIIVKYGLDMIGRKENARVGLEALIELTSGKGDFKRKKKVKITSGYVGFTLAPRINAAGRVRSASLSVELFLAEDKDKAMAIAEELCRANDERKAEENKIMADAYKKIEAYDLDKNPVIVLDADDWHHGVIGIVSSRITEKYGRPSILVSFEGNAGEKSGEDVGKGSGRSIKGLNLVDALCYCDEYLVKFGGHELAAGLSVTRENLPLFIEKINEYANSNLNEDDLVPTVEADCEIEFSDVNLTLAEELRKLEPYGVGNPVPLFVMRNLPISEITGISDGKHSRISFTNGRNSLSGMFFSAAPDTLGVYVGDTADLLFSIDINEWMDRRSVQLLIRDIKPSERTYCEKERQKERFEEIKNGDTFTKDENILPDRSDFVNVYRFIQVLCKDGPAVISHRELLAKVSGRGRIEYIKLKFMIMIMKELNLLGIEEISDEVYRFTVRYQNGKTNLDKSNILRKIRTQLR